MKRIMMACVAVAAFAAPAFAADGATYELKAGAGDYTGTHVDPLTNPVGYYSSDATGNGGVVGGHGSAWNGADSKDQTTTPGSRADAVQDVLSLVGKGRK